MSNPHPADPSNPAESYQPPTLSTVEAVVRHQMAQALGGRRGMAEAGIPSIIFTLLWLTTSNLQVSLIASAAVAVVALALRMVQRSTTQFVWNALFGIAIGWVFVRISAGSGGSETDQALAFFLPGIIWSGVYTVLLVVSCLARWPLFGFMLGSVTGDPLAWRQDRQIVKLCQHLTWLFLLPGAVGVALQGPVWLLGHTEVISASTAVAVIAVLRLGFGWVLRIGSWATMVWLLARNATPIDPDSPLASVQSDQPSA